MKLYGSDTSPFVRKVRIVALASGLAEHIEDVTINPYEQTDALRAKNPLGKIPALERPEGGLVYDSRVIVQYLLSLAEASALLPSGAARIDVLRREALADGMTDAAVAWVMETRRPEAQRSELWIDRWRAAILAGADVLEREIAAWGEAMTLAHIAAGVSLGYLDFRHPDLDWRGGRPALTAWAATIHGEPAFAATRPPPA
ncbi:MAG: glutathione S-transferase N-terminal domain-containing protein [Maricaulaceae bacterium]